MLRSEKVVEWIGESLSAAKKAETQMAYFLILTET